MFGIRNLIIQLLVVFLSTALIAAAQAAAVVLTKTERLPDGSLQLQAHGAAGMVYSLQISRDGHNWRTIDFLPSVSGIVALTDDASTANSTTRYYRVRADRPDVSMDFADYRSWTNSIILRNSQAEVDVVPAIGRIMQFRLLGQQDGPFWENPDTFGDPPAADSWNHIGSFGGDKVWPAPQSLWQWPPPRAFDSMADTAVVTNGTVILTSPVDPAYGLRVVRRITLHPTEPILRVSSTFEKVSGEPGTFGVWIVTQTKPTSDLFLPVPNDSAFPNGCVDLGERRSEVTRQGNLVPYGWNSRAPGKIGNDATALLWMDDQCELLLESPRAPGKTAYPDHGCHAEIYTNPGRAAYLELEFLGPLCDLAVPDTAELTSYYSLFPRAPGSAVAEANRLLGR